MRILCSLAVLLCACGPKPAPVEPEPDPGEQTTEPETEEIVLDTCFSSPLAHSVSPCVHAFHALNKLDPHFVISTDEEYQSLIELVEEHHIGFIGEDPSEPHECLFPEIDFQDHTLLAMKVHSGHICSLKDWDHHIQRLEEENKIVFSATITGTGHCKGKPVSWWIMVLVPKFPPDWEVEFTFEHVHLEKGK
jgi:hypothetical protein